jgi:hypothetical protein
MTKNYSEDLGKKVIEYRNSYVKHQKCTVKLTNQVYKKPIILNFESISKTQGLTQTK